MMGTEIGAADQLVEAIARLAGDPAEQAAYLHAGVWVLPEELVNEFEEWWEVHQSLGREPDLGPDFYAKIAEIVGALQEFGGEDWEEHSIRSSPRWSEVRRLARAALLVSPRQPSERTWVVRT